MTTSPGADDGSDAAVVAASLRDVPDFPQPGVVFKDITPLLADPDAFATVIEALAEWHARAEGSCAVDYGFHQILGGIDDESLKAMRYLTENEGVTSFKLFMAYPGVFYSDDGQILRAMQRAAELGALISMHAENGIAIDVLAEQAAARAALHELES